MEQLLIDVVIFLATALIGVRLSVRLGFGSVLGYRMLDRGQWRLYQLVSRSGFFGRAGCPCCP
jgi:hypothetical protein